MKEKPQKKRILLKLFSVVFIVLLTATVATSITVLKKFNIEKPVYIYIDHQKSFEEVVTQLKNEANLPSEKIFRFLADKMKYSRNVKTGRYAITGEMNMVEAIRNLRGGRQTPIQITFNNIRTKENLAGRLSRQLLLDSLSLLQTFNDSATLNTLGLNSYTVVALFIPNTYEVYWDTSAQKLLGRMKREYDHFWNGSRKRKAQDLGLSPVEVSTLASIVEEEATFAEEYSTVAGLYLNRLTRGMKLEADPTVKFAVGDFALRRILYKHLEIESPYMQVEQ